MTSKLNLDSRKILSILEVIKEINNTPLENIYIDDERAFKGEEFIYELKLIGMSNWYLVKDKFRKNEMGL